MAQNQKQIVTSSLLAATSEIQRDLRDQVSMCAPYLKNYNQPIVVLSRERLRKNVQRFHKALPTVKPHYAVKANPDEEILKVLMKEGVNFEIASQVELEILKKLNIEPSAILFSNPIKAPQAIKEASKYGVEWFAADTPEEVIKIAQINRSAKIFLRIAVSNKGSMWPLCKKFGAEGNAVNEIIQTAVRNHIRIEGVSFHVGSQCSNSKNWLDGINRAKKIFTMLEYVGMKPSLLNIGGGFPIQLSETDPTIDDLAFDVNKALESISSSIDIVAEPGRYMIGSAGCLITKIIGVATRKDARWIYLDSGFYGGLMEMAESFPTTVISQRT
ncbi:MAG: type III PLP-dependent enzyme, partial [Pseudomonadota bacterium]|nr:type III PLP-dependent enzyme [Pseudomonadota bacterium]